MDTGERPEPVVDEFQKTLEARSKSLRDHCDPTEKFSARGIPTFIWIEKLDLLYLNIPKVATTTWKTLIKQVNCLL